MTENIERLSRNDVENKLDKYKTLNRQISKKLNEKRIKIAKLEKRFTVEVTDFRNKCSKWKSKILKVRNMYSDTDHTTMEVEMLKSNADKTKKILNECIDDVDQILATQAPVSIECTKKRRKKEKGRRLLVLAVGNAIRAASMEREQAVGIVSNNCGSEEKADNDGQSKKSDDGVPNFFDSEENDGSAEHDGTKSMATEESNTKNDNESDRISSFLWSRPKRNPAPIDYLRF